jgi:type I restriction enzyme, S subunit
LASKKPKKGYKLVKNFFQKYLEIPEEWNYERYGDIFQEIKEPIEFSDDEEYDLITVKRNNLGLISRGVLKGKDILTKNLHSVQEGDFLIARMQIVHGACGLVPKSLSHAKISGSYLRLKSSNKTNLEYLNFLSHTPFFYQQTFVSSVGSNIEKMNLNQRHWFNHYFPLPPNKEQEKIVSIFSNISNLIETHEKILIQIKQMKKGLIQQLLTKGIGHKKFKKVKWLFGKEIEIPEEWELIYLEKLVLSYRNGIYKPEKFHGSGIPNIRMYNLKDGKIEMSNLDLLEVSKGEFLDYKLEKEDIVVNRVNSPELVGKSGIVNNESQNSVFDSMNIRIKLDNGKTIPQFVITFFNSSYFFSQIRSRVKNAIAQASINQDDLNTTKMVLPSIPEQEKIIVLLSKVDLKIDDLESKKTNLEDLKKGLMQKLLTGEIRV